MKHQVSSYVAEYNSRENISLQLQGILSLLSNIFNELSVELISLLCVYSYLVVQICFVVYLSVAQVCQKILSTGVCG